jgi:hypothetical protein
MLKKIIVQLVACRSGISWSSTNASLGPIAYPDSTPEPTKPGLLSRLPRIVEQYVDVRIDDGGEFRGGDWRLPYSTT